jgi:hypothetical protein
MSVFDSDYKLFDNRDELHDKLHDELYKEIDNYIGKIYSIIELFFDTIHPNICEEYEEY